MLATVTRLFGFVLNCLSDAFLGFSLGSAIPRYKAKVAGRVSIGRESIIHPVAEGDRKRFQLQVGNGHPVLQNKPGFYAPEAAT